MGKATNYIRPRYFLRAAIGGGVIFNFLCNHVVGAEGSIEADLEKEDDALFLVERGRV
jgi:hypothetical protein